LALVKPKKNNTLAFSLIFLKKEYTFSLSVEWLTDPEGSICFFYSIHISFYIFFLSLHQITTEALSPLINLAAAAAAAVAVATATATATTTTLTTLFNCHYLLLLIFFLSRLNLDRRNF
jgi:hypothetical protein